MPYNIKPDPEVQEICGKTTAHKRAPKCPGASGQASPFLCAALMNLHSEVVLVQLDRSVWQASRPRGDTGRVSKQSVVRYEQLSRAWERFRVVMLESWTDDRQAEQ